MGQDQEPVKDEILQFEEDGETTSSCLLCGEMKNVVDYRFVWVRRAPVLAGEHPEPECYPFCRECAAGHATEEELRSAILQVLQEWQALGVMQGFYFQTPYLCGGGLEHE